MLRMTFAGMSGLMTMLLMACGGSAPTTPTVAVAENPPSVTQLSVHENLAALEESIDEAVKEFGLDVATNAVRMFRHTIWVLADEDTIKDKLVDNRYELVGEVIRGTDQAGSGINIWGVESPPMSGEIGRAHV